MNRLRLCAGPLAFCLLDAMLTLIGQPATYWSGNWSNANEVNPLAYWLLQLHPVAFVVGVAATLAVYAWVLSRARLNLARVLAFAILFGHAVGAGSWMVRWGLPGYLLVVLLLVSASSLVSIREGVAARLQRADSRPFHDPSTLETCSHKANK